MLHARYRIPFFLSALILLITLVYLPGAKGGFYFDDHPHIVQNSALAMEEFSLEELKRTSFSSKAGPWMRPVAMGSIAINYHFSALDPLPYKLTNIAIHVLNATLLMIFFLMISKLVTHAPANQLFLQKHYWVATLIATAFWALHPLNVTSVLYVIQRMTSMSATFSLLALISYTYARPRIGQHWKWLVFGILSFACFGVVAALCKETAWLLPVFVLVLEFTLFQKIQNTPRYWLILRNAALVIGILFIGAWVIQNLVLGNWAQSAYAARPFTLSERVLTESRIVWQYWKLILLPNIQDMGLYLDDVAYSKSLFSPPITFLAILSHAILIWSGILLRKKYPVASFGILWFYSGHLLESTIFPLELMYEHRNYIPIMGPAFALSHYGLLGFQRLSSRMKPVAVTSTLLLLALLATGTLMRAQQFGNAWTFPFSEAEHHPNSSRANFFAGRICAELAINNPKSQKEYLECAFSYLNRASIANPSAAEPLIVMIQTLIVSRLPVPSPLLDQLESRLASQPLGNHGSFLAKGLLDIGRSTSTNIPESRIDRLFNAAIDNDRLIRVNRAHMLVAKGILLCDVRHDCASGLQELGKAAAIEPTAQFYVILATYQLSQAKIEDAMNSLQKAEVADSRKLFRKTVADLRKHAIAQLGNP